MFDYKLEHICSYTATLQSPPEVIGPVPDGIRANFYVTGGTVHGPKLRGTFRPAGGDWVIVRADGVGVLDVRATIESHDGALIYVTYGGVADFGEDGYQKFLRGELPPTVAPRVAPRFQTAHPGYLWMNRLQCVGIGEADTRRNEASYDVHAVR